MGVEPVRVAAYGYFGMGNIGNEGSLAAFLAQLRDAHPEIAASCFAADAVAVNRDHGIPATQLMAYRTDRRGVLAQASKAASRLWDIPRTFRMMGDVDVLVVPGTGVLETQLVPQPWGLPYWLFLAALSCRLRGRTVALVSVGAEHAAHPVTRWFYRWTVRLSHYCSYRDEASRQAVASMGVTGERGRSSPTSPSPCPPPQDPRSAPAMS